MAVRLQSINFPDFFIRHQNFEAELMKPDSPGFAEDFLWEERFRGKDDAGFTLVRFESINRPNHFLRHTDFRLVLQRDENNELFKKDSTFRRRNGRAGDPEDGWRSFEASNFENRFIRHRNFHVFVESNEKNPSTFNSDATFRRVDA
ncbi:AbfB domain-containing protein [Pseudonocardia sp. C8]|uniref:AbfB domain-containing protein n=1 Tax=Pseudonocardia sp. C8 TaxID=2762759 RepID=UPI0016427864|nr:AbfB domain-containing protein [Pseudonocardia sp. C8]MBC3193249.1 AbfB domain-containing protein [Pseudonocardia sp. C8]